MVGSPDHTWYFIVMRWLHGPLDALCCQDDSRRGLDTLEHQVITEDWGFGQGYQPELWGGERSRLWGQPHEQVLQSHLSNKMSVKTGNWGTDELYGLTVLHARINYHNSMLKRPRCLWESRSFEFEACLIPASTLCISSFGWFWVVSFSYNITIITGVEFSWILCHSSELLKLMIVLGNAQSCNWCQVLDWLGSLEDYVFNLKFG